MLNITQPTLSGQVKELEERYGTKLFVRHGRRIELTDLGKSAFSITRLMFRYEEEVEHLLQSARALTSGELRVAADSPYIATPLLAQFQRLYPGIQILGILAPLWLIVRSNLFLQCKTLVRGILEGWAEDGRFRCTSFVSGCLDIAREVDSIKC